MSASAKLGQDPRPLTVQPTPNSCWPRFGHFLGLSVPKPAEFLPTGMRGQKGTGG